MVPVGNIWAAPIPSATRRHFTVQLGSIRAAPTRSAIPRPITAQADSIKAAAIVSAVASIIASATIAVEASVASPIPKRALKTPLLAGVAALSVLSTSVAYAADESDPPLTRFRPWQQAWQC